MLKSPFICVGFILYEVPSFFEGQKAYLSVLGIWCTLYPCHWDYSVWYTSNINLSRWYV